MLYLGSYNFLLTPGVFFGLLSESTLLWMINHHWVCSPGPKKGYEVAVSREYEWTVSMHMCKALKSVRRSLGWVEKGRGQPSMGILSPNLVFPVTMKVYFSKKKKTYLFNSLFM